MVPENRRRRQAISVREIATERVGLEQIEVSQLRKRETGLGDDSAAYADLSKRSQVGFLSQRVI